MGSKSTPVTETPTKATPTNWQISIHLVDGKHATAQPWDSKIKNGDTVSFTSPDGVPRVVFEGVSPFSTEPGFIIPDAGAQKVVNLHTCTQANPAQGYCWIKPHGTETYIGYGTNSSKDKSGIKVPPIG